MKFLNKVMMGYEPTFKSMKQYKKKVIHPIIHALELHMILGGVNGDTIIHDWAEETEHSMDYAIEVMKYVSAKIAFGYHLLAEYIFGLWD